MSDIFYPAFIVPAPESDTRATATALTAEQRDFTAAVSERLAMHADAMEVGEVDRLLTFFTEDAVWMGAGWPSRFGKSQFKELFTEVAGTARVRSTCLAAHVAGESGWTFVDYAVEPKDPSVSPWTFRTAFQWMRKDGTWLCNGVLCHT